MKTISSEEFKSKRAGSAIFQFSANWCGPCHALTPVLKEIAESNGVECFKIDVTTSPSLSREMNVMSIPAVFMYKEGELSDSFVGARNKLQIEEMIKRVYGVN